MTEFDKSEQPMANPYLSIVIPVHNEQEMLELLYERLTKALDSYGKSYEVLLVNDGSRDQSASMLNAIQQKRPDVFRIIHLNGNFGQHLAIMAGLENIRGDIAVTMDADLQNPPEEIPKLIDCMEQGDHDVVGGYRLDRQDSRWRIVVSRMHNWVRAKFMPRLIMRDEGCMLRAYRKSVVELMTLSQEASTFIPALAMMYATNPGEVGVKHEARSAGYSKYNLYVLIRYNFDVITNFSLTPLHLFTLVGMTVAACSGLFVIYMFIRRIFVGPEADGVFTLFALLFLLIGIGLFGLGIIGEYVGRIYQEVRKRPRFVIKQIVEQ